MPHALADGQLLVEAVLLANVDLEGDEVSELATLALPDTELVAVIDGNADTDLDCLAEADEQRVAG